MKILKFFKLVFIGLLILELIIHLFIIIDIGKFFLDTKSLIITLLIISFLIEKHFFSVLLLLYSFCVIILSFSPMFISEKTVEKIYYELFLGGELSSYIRNNTMHNFWLVNILINFSYYLSGYIILFEIPSRFYKRKYITI